MEGVDLRLERLDLVEGEILDVEPEPDIVEIVVDLPDISVLGQADKVPSADRFGARLLLADHIDVEVGMAVADAFDERAGQDDDVVVLHRGLLEDVLGRNDQRAVQIGEGLVSDGVLHVVSLRRLKNHAPSKKIVRYASCQQNREFLHGS